MELTERKKKILRAIVDSYIQTAEPVGSKALSGLPGLNCSSATIRNEMADLTQMGLLEQPHTSAGRVPSPAGYRLYVDELMQDYRLSVDETQSLNQAMELKMQEVDKVISQVSKLVSQMTNLPAVAMTASSNAPTIEQYDLLPGHGGSVIVVLTTSTEAIKNRLIKFPVECSDQDLKLLSAVLNASLTGIPAAGFTPELLQRVSRSAGAAAPLVPIIVDYATHVLTVLEKSEVYVTGQMKLLGQPEYRDIDKAQEVLATLDGDILSNLPATLGDTAKTRILVGPENIAKELKDTSVVMTRFDIGDGMQGLIGVVGPTRMDYAQVTARLSYFAENLGRMFNKYELPAPENTKSGDD